MVTLLCLLATRSVYVAASGSDAWQGTAARPVASLERAIELARSTAARRIVVGAGEYPLRASIALDARDSGLTIEAIAGTRPLFTGAVVVPASAISPSRDGGLQSRVAALDPYAEAFRIDVSKLKGARLAPFTPYGFPRPIVPSPDELFAGEKPMVVARWPNAGYTTIKSVREPGNGEGDRDKPLRHPVFTAMTDRAKTWKSIDDAWLYGYWKFDWADETIKLHSVDPETGEITLETPHTFGVEANAPFFAENLPEELDAVGEYYADLVQDSVRFVAKKKAHPTYRLSLLVEPLLSLKGAKNITIRGLDFGYSRGDGIRIEDCTNTRLEACRLFDLGDRGAVVEGGHDSGLEACDIWNTGEGGVSLNGGNRQTLTPARLFVDNCDIHDYMRRAQTYRPAVNLYGVGNRVSHCAIHDAPHSAIIFGGNNQVIEYNEFYRTLSRTGDGGVVYTGRNWTARGTVIRSNYFHDNRGMGKWEPAIYFDDLASGLTATGNVIERCWWGFLIGGGRDNVISGNEIIDCRLAFDCDARGLGWAANSLPTMKAGLAQVPYQDATWRAAYPTLPHILAHDPMAPMGNVIRDNLLLRSGTLMQATEAPFAKTTAYRNNEVVEGTGKPRRRRIDARRMGLVKNRLRGLL